MLMYKFSFPSKKKDKPIYFPTNSQNNLSGFGLCIIHALQDQFMFLQKKNGYNTLPGFTLIQWNQIIVITRNAVRNDE